LASFIPKLHDEYDNDFCQGYNKMYSQLNQPEDETSSPPVSSARLSITALAASRVQTRSTCFCRSTQLDDYLISAPIEDNDLLAFWHAHAKSFLGVAQMAKDVLAVLITGVGVLHMFSITQRICSYQRYRSGVEIMKRMIIVQHCECIAEEEELDD
jgi:hypothetical protein